MNVNKLQYTIQTLQPYPKHFTNLYPVQDQYIFTTYQYTSTYTHHREQFNKRYGDLTVEFDFLYVIQYAYEQMCGNAGLVFGGDIGISYLMSIRQQIMR